MKISEQLASWGIGFKRSEEEFFPLPVDDENTSLPAAEYFLEKTTLGRIHSAWKQWRSFASRVLSSTAGMSFVSKFFARGIPEKWNDWERSEIGSFTTKSNYFFGPHVTRIDFGLNRDHQLVIIDPNVMPYGITPMVATQKILGIKTQEEYLEQLRVFNPTWVADRSHGSASGIKWLTDQVRANFSFSDEFSGAENVVRLSRKDIKGTSATVGSPGIRIFESQIWNALMNISGIPDFFGFGLDLALHRANCAPCFLVRLGIESLEVAFSFNKGDLQWMKFEDFAATQWALGAEKVFLKCLATSGCHQVTASDFKKRGIVKAINAKLGVSGYFLIQPGLPCIVNAERVRVSSYLGPNREHYGSEVTRVPPENSFVHGGSHAKLSYLVL